MPAAASAFPENIVELLAERLGTLDGVTVVVKRWLNHIDSNGAIGIAVEEWQPDEWESGSRVNVFEPTLATYVICIQHMVKNAEAEAGNREHRDVAKNIRLMLYRDAELQLAFAALNDNADGILERIQRWGTTAQRFASNDIQGQFTYLSVTEFAVQTETV